MAIDQVTGFIYIVFYDRRNYTDNRTDVYLAYSTDGGETFVNKQISTNPFTPNQNIFFGDYTNITAYNNKVIPIWTRMDNSIPGIVCAIIDNTTTDLSLENNIKTSSEEMILKVYPSYVSNAFNIELNIKYQGTYNIFVYNSLGVKVATILNNNSLTKGIHTFNFNLNNINNGVYLIEIFSQYNIDKVKFLVVN
jgi:hypothetical protein